MFALGDVAAGRADVFTRRVGCQFNAAQRRAFGLSAASAFLAFGTARLGALHRTTVAAQDGGGQDCRGGVTVGGVAIVRMWVVMFGMIMPVVTAGRRASRVAVARTTSVTAPRNNRQQRHEDHGQIGLFHLRLLPNKSLRFLQNSV